MDLAESQGRVVITLDKDFWQIALQRRTPLERSGVVLFKIHPAIPENIGPLMQALASANRSWIGHISIIAADGIHMLPARRN